MTQKCLVLMKSDSEESNSWPIAVSTDRNKLVQCVKDDMVERMQGDAEFDDKYFVDNGDSFEYTDPEYGMEGYTIEEVPMM